MPWIDQNEVVREFLIDGLTDEQRIAMGWTWRDRPNGEILPHDLDPYHTYEAVIVENVTTSTNTVV